MPVFFQDRESTRGFFIDVWGKYRDGKPLQPVEQIIATVILDHPEYHVLLEDRTTAMRHDAVPGAGVENPFLHMGMHIAIREQVQADRPAGIAGIYRSLIEKGHLDPHNLEHDMMECLGQTLWMAQRANSIPDENEYLECIKRIG